MRGRQVWGPGTEPPPPHREGVLAWSNQDGSTEKAFPRATPGSWKLPLVVFSPDSVPYSHLNKVLFCLTATTLTPQSCSH